MSMQIQAVVDASFETTSNGIGACSASSSGSASGVSATAHRRGGGGGAVAVVKKYTHDPYRLSCSPQQQQQQRAISGMSSFAAAFLAPVACAPLSGVSSAETQQQQHPFAFVEEHDDVHADKFAQSAAAPSSLDADLLLAEASAGAGAAQHPHHELTLHKPLIGRVSFVPYPAESLEFPPSDDGVADFDNADDGEARRFAAAAAPHDQQQQWTRLFIGQVPYKVTAMQLQWLFHTFAAGASLRDCERITKKNKLGAGAPRMPTGCIHANIREHHVERAIAGMHKRILIDDSGVWFAATRAEQAELDHYLALLKADPRRRVPERPYDSLVVQRAESKFFPSNPRWVSDAPQQEQFLSFAHGFYADANVQSAEQRMRAVQHQQHVHYQQPMQPAPVFAVDNAAAYYQHHQQSYGYFN